MPAGVEAVMLSGEHISQLIGDTLCLANHSVNVPVRMPVNPVVGSTIHNKVILLRRECAVNTTSLEVRG